MPAILLAGFGLLSLRQDRVLALQQAAEEAERIATDLTRTVLPQALFGLDLPDVTEPRWQPRGLPENDPVLLRASGSEPRIVWLAEQDLRLVYPPPVRPWPKPEPLRLEDLTPEQQAAWWELEKAGADVPATTAVNALQDAPARWSAMAWYRLALRQFQSNAWSDAGQSFQQVISQFPNELSEAGYRLSTFAQVQLFRLTDRTGAPAQSETLAKALCQQAILEPSALSEMLLETVDSASATQVSAAEWWRVWDAHETARALHSHWQKDEHPPQQPGSPAIMARWVEKSGTTPARWLVGAHPNAGRPRFWFVALDEEQVRQVVNRVVATLPRPNYLDVAVHAEGRPVVNLPDARAAQAGSAMPLFQSASGAAALRAGGVDAGNNFPLSANTGGGISPAALTVSVYLTSPQKLYARQRARTFWSVGIIAVSVVAVFIGFVTAWRAFRRQQQLAEMKSNFVSAVSHELRAPIASIRLMSEELEDLGAQAAVRSGEYHRLIARECRRLSSLIENVLDFSRQEQGRNQYSFERADLDALVHATVDLMQPCAADRSVALQVRSATSTWAVLDSRAVQQAVVNLIDNALKHSPPGGTVTVGLDKNPAARAPRQRSMSESPPPPGRENGLVHLWVEDHGPGIPPEEHDRIFERFYRCGSELRRETPGIGLGLAIVKHIAEAHRGRVTVRSVVGEGSRFTLELPVAGPVGEKP